VIVKRLVETMDGSIVVSSSPGAGSTFRILLPHRSSLPAADASVEPWAGLVGDASTPRPQATTARVLYVEDNPINACVMQAIFELNEGLELHVESTGGGALEWIRENPADLVMLDMNLPDFDGIGLLHEMRLVCPHPFPTAVAVSADAMPELVEAAKLAGFNQYWTKPLDAAKTLEWIDAAVRRDQRTITPARSPAPAPRS
jgi:CheY-like chemotaxis protein